MKSTHPFHLSAGSQGLEQLDPLEQAALLAPPFSHAGHSAKKYIYIFNLCAIVGMKVGDTLDS